MLRALSIRDYVIVGRLDLEFGAGFNALTGETGAGKSILVDALALAIGGRAEPLVVRPGAERAEVSAAFETAEDSAARRWLRANDLEEDDGACLLRRVVERSGRTRAFVNGRPATVAQLREIGERLVDIHGQHDHQLLLRREHARELLDAFGGHSDLARSTGEAHGRWRRLATQRAARESAQAHSAREREALRDEVRDLEALGFDAEGWARDLADHRRIAHAQELIETVTACAEELDESDAALTTRLAHAASRLADAAQFDARLEEARRDVEAAGLQAGEAAQQLRRYLSSLETDPGRLAELERRLRAVHDMARRYRLEPAAIPEALAQRRARLEELGGEESLEDLRAQEAEALRAFRDAAQALSRKRRESARRLAAEVTRTMQQLGMEGGSLAVALEPLDEPHAGGLESVELQVSAHPGQPLAPLARVASGGELSRLALAVQVLLSGRASVPTLVFDEVDAGIGGAVAEIVGRLLQSLSAHHQVFCVTHLAQVAAHARAQFRVAKAPGPGGTLATTEPLDPDERVEEIARMLGGLRITEATRRHAAEMLQGARAPEAPRARQKGRAAARPA